MQLPFCEQSMKTLALEIVKNAAKDTYMLYVWVAINEWILFSCGKLVESRADIHYKTETRLNKN